MLEDRLQRLAALAEDPASTSHLIQELLVHRQWSVDDHPEWLVFEAEQQLQIRPSQYWVAAHLLDNPGHIVQLNMGEGKTRVILPMLVLAWANGDNLVRLNFLPALLDEAYAHLHACLCASALGRKLFVQPFHRDVQVAPASLAAMRASLAYCQLAGGMLLTTAERRLSMLLKRKELWQKGQAELCAGLDELAALPYADVLDESDELLRHTYQLIYAAGAPAELPSQPARARACQSLLHALSSQGRSGAMGDPGAGGRSGAQRARRQAGLLQGGAPAAWRGAEPRCACSATPAGGGSAGGATPRAALDEGPLPAGGAAELHQRPVCRCPRPDERHASRAAEPS